MSMAKGEKPKKKAHGGKRTVRSITITKAKNGHAVHHELEPSKKRMPGGGMMGQYEASPDPSVFQDYAAMMDHVGALAGQMGGEDGEEAGEAPEAA